VQLREVSGDGASLLGVTKKAVVFSLAKRGGGRWSIFVSELL
jgi:hypothetical protein